MMTLYRGVHLNFSEEEKKNNFLHVFFKKLHIKIRAVVK